MAAWVYQHLRKRHQSIKTRSKPLELPLIITLFRFEVLANIIVFIEAVIVIADIRAASEEAALTEDMDIVAMGITVDTDQTDIPATVATRAIKDITATALEETYILVLFSLQRAVNSGI